MCETMKLLSVNKWFAKRQMQTAHLQFTETKAVINKGKHNL